MLNTAQKVSLPNSGILMVVGAFLIWGLSPLYFRSIALVSPMEILAHRAVWSFFLLLLINYRKGQFSTFYKMLTHGPTLGVLVITALLVSSNWLIHIWAILNHHLIEASFGYFIVPIMNIFLGTLFLKEQLNRYQKISLGLTLIALSSQIVLIGSIPWISLALAFTFALYGLIRKQIKIDSLLGLTVETTVLLLPSLTYLGYLWSSHELLFLTTPSLSILLMFAGFITALPLFLFIAGSKILPLSSVGFFQYISPTGQFLLAYFLFHEPMDPLKWLSYSFIWLALTIFIADSIYTANKRRKSK